MTAQTRPAASFTYSKSIPTSNEVGTAHFYRKPGLNLELWTQRDTILRGVQRERKKVPEFGYVVAISNFF